jgi:tRNA pseudouridine55 synthase
MIDGIFNVNKPSGMTSFRVVSLIKKFSGEKHVGHAGTLDPAATGVLPVCLGRATRIIEYLMDTSKAYKAEIELGVSTDTYDAEGKVTSRTDASGISRTQLDTALEAFHGPIEQVPPIYSALKYQGRPLYELARSGVEIELNSRTVTVHSLDVIDWQSPLVTMKVVCSKGTYIRSIAHDLGHSLGCGAYLKNLVRLKCGIFDIKDSVSISQIEDGFRFGFWQQFIYPMDTAMTELPSIVVNTEGETDIKKGRPLTLNDFGNYSNIGTQAQAEQLHKNLYRAYTLDGSFLAVLLLNPENGMLHPQKVFI